MCRTGGSEQEKKCVGRISRLKCDRVSVTMTDDITRHYCYVRTILRCWTKAILCSQSRLRTVIEDTILYSFTIKQIPSKSASAIAACSREGMEQLHGIIDKARATHSPLLKTAITKVRESNR